jgi:hypothetical protein
MLHKTVKRFAMPILLIALIYIATILSSCEINRRTYRVPDEWVKTDEEVIEYITGRLFDEFDEHFDVEITKKSQLSYDRITAIDRSPVRGTRTPIKNAYHYWFRLYDATGERGFGEYSTSYFRDDRLSRGRFFVHLRNEGQLSERYQLQLVDDRGTYIAATQTD